jgi:hypothetical protein
MSRKKKKKSPNSAKLNVEANATTPRQDTEAQKPPAPTHKKLGSWWTGLPRWKKILGSLLSLVIVFYFQYAPSWSLDLPSASFRPENPFTAVFTITNVGYLPASRVSIQCTQRMIEYSDPPDTFSANLVAPLSTSNWVPRNGKLSTLCTQVVAGLQVWHRALSDKEVKELYEKSLREGPPLNENPHIVWADLIFTIHYCAVLPLWTWTEERRVKGELGEDGKFVLMHVSVDQLYDRPSYRAWLKQQQLMKERSRGR